MAPPKKWDDSESEEESSDESVDVPVATPRRKFDDEEDSDDVRWPVTLDNIFMLTDPGCRQLGRRGRL